MKIREVGSKLFREDVQTDVTKLIVAVRGLANAPPPPKFQILPTHYINVFCIYLTKNRDHFSTQQ